MDFFIRSSAAAEPFASTGASIRFRLVSSETLDTATVTARPTPATVNPVLTGRRRRFFAASAK